MQLARPASAVHPRRFGRGPYKQVAAQPVAARATVLGDDVKLFVTTFAAGFVFVSILLA
ncbi:MAG TPA: hypothetical protein VFR92_00620 [Sphingomicrobium sp.]|jgi:hypothetical protein|nr:hypothetical protein [Sphingomicrobium sp.]